MRPHRPPSPHRGRVQVTTETLTIDRLGSHGDGLGRTADGEMVAVPYTAPGDHVRATITRTQGRAHGVMAELITASPHRTRAPCPYFAQCGGCAIQHIARPEYQRFKQSLVVDALVAHGLGDGVHQVKPPHIIDPAFRRRTNFKIKRDKHGLSFGYHRPQSNQIVPITSCLLLTPQLNRVIEPMTGFLAHLMDPGERADLFLTHGDNGIDGLLTFDGRHPLTLPEREGLSALITSLPFARFQVTQGGFVDFLMEQAKPVVRIAEHPVPIEAGCFLQASKTSDHVLGALVLDALSPLKPGARILDLFCGRGTLTLPMASAGYDVVGVDSDKSAIDALGTAIKHARFKTHLIHRNLFTDPLMDRDLKGADAIVLNPPRAGAKEQIRPIAAGTTPIIVMVSCNPQTFARDARTLKDGGYSLISALPIDQFLYTAHVEIVGVFRRVPPSEKAYD